jgi:putative endopeptidase
MKKLYSIALLGLGFFAQAQDNHLLASQDKSIRVQDDLYRHVNQKWLKTAKIPSHLSSWGSFDVLIEKTEEQCLNIMKDIVGKAHAANSNGQKIKDLYLQYTNMAQRNALGLKPIEKDLAEIDAIKNMADMEHYLAQGVRKGNNPFYGWGVGSDTKSSNDNAIYLGRPKLGLNQDDYLKNKPEHKKMREQYATYLAKLYKILKYDQPEEMAKKHIAFEIGLAKNILNKEEERDPIKTYNLRSVVQLSEMVKNINLPNYLKEAGVNTKQVIIADTKYYAYIDQFLNAKNLEQIKHYLKLNMLNDSMGFLTEDLEKISFDYYSTQLSGVKNQQPMEKRALFFVIQQLPDAFGQAYIEKYFSPEVKTNVIEMVGYIKRSYEKRIQQLSWMSPATKTKAIEKLNKMGLKMVHPDQWKDYSQIQIESDPNENKLHQNLDHIFDFEYQKELNKIGTKVDKSEWGMNCFDINAYYRPGYNDITFLAAILQQPFYDVKADPAINFGAIGGIIGHEISHGFDDQGAQYDADGNLNDWWTAEDKKKFKTYTQGLVKQYKAYSPIKGNYVNGQITLGENIADLGGINVAFDALQTYLKEKGDPGKIDNLSQNERFFYAWGRAWKSLITPEYQKNLLKWEPHSPSEFRANGVLPNTDAFQETFKLKPGDKLYRAPKDRIKIW